MKPQHLLGILALSLLMYAGGEPSPGTRPDMRKGENKKKYGTVANRNVNAGKKPATVKPAMPKKGGTK